MRPDLRRLGHGDVGWLPLMCWIGAKEVVVLEGRKKVMTPGGGFVTTAQKLHNLKDETCRLQKLISDSIEESNATKQHLIDALEQNERYKADVCKVDQKLELTKKELCKERRMLLDANQEKQNVFSLFEAKEREHKQQLESMAVHIRELLKAVAEFECRVTQDITLFS
ncbi:WPP domain-associated protein-like [Pyrus ussuriensis x Pyrus communis]|uniref:WPP domain-associated protein-like n=1 Tax=Pyrus ussuriensis x Pyrus communis TaxID=2448454 RepID=A0A5N5IAG6_9ROSA|nr:WPP domain-associated protein-like [Pyrus ussuriensis x Pyrus communis]